MKKIVLTLGLAALALLPLGQGDAAVRPLDVAGLAQGATLIIRGTVVSHDIHQQEDSRGTLIVTDHRIRVTETLKGRLPSNTGEIVLETEGGRIGQLICRSWEEPSVARGEDLVLYLAPSQERPGVMRCYGAFQGKLTLLDGRLREERDRRWEDYRAELLGHLKGRKK
jgi:hypothetical protein